MLLEKKRLTPKERILKAIRHEEPGRVPLNIWLYREDYSKLVADKYGSVEAFFDEYGIDVLHLSDDWGQNNRMLFSPECWWEFVFPHDKAIVDVGKRAGVPVSLHSCGYMMDVVGGCVDLGLDVLNPIQTSAGTAGVRTDNPQLVTRNS
jgi:hypothetical protein